MHRDRASSSALGEGATGQAGPKRPPARRRRLQGSVFIGASIATGAFALAACGGGGGSSGDAVAHVGSSKPAGTATGDGPIPAGGGTASASASATAVKFASCVRAHGVANFPDSAVNITPNGGVEFHLAKGTVNPGSPQLKSAMQACQGLIPHANVGGSGPSAHSMDQLLKYVQCMRSHGVTDFPEPNSHGQIMVQITGGAGNNNPLNPGSPQFQAASQACRSLQPQGLTGL
jgi:hypothetical protein